MLEFAILGPLEVRHEGRLLDLGGPRRRAVLAVLLLHRGEAVAADRLVQALWGDDAPPTAAKALHVHVSKLRRGLGAAASRLRTESSGYRLAVDPGELDAERFERALDDGRELLVAGQPAEAARALRDALAVWRGPALADLRYEAFAQPEIGRLEELRALAIEERVEADLALGEHSRLIGELEMMIAAHPTRERLRAQHMLALYRAGRHIDALAAYREARTVLDAELGLEPGPELRHLEQAILRHAPELDGADATPAVPPPPPTPTFGREEDVSRVVKMLDEAQCLTLVGPGGVGKTRLAVEVARRVQGQFVTLASTADADRVPAVICDAIHVVRAPEESARAALERVLDRAARVLVVDNLEHLPDASRVLAGLIERHAGLRILATSRQPLRIRAERVFPVEPLNEAPAVALFADRARAHDPSFAVTPAVATICARLSGLPLAIELAAARLAVLTPEALATRLDNALAVLGPGPSDVPARQQTLRATLDWSFALLSESERDVFAALAAFAGGCDLDAAEAVTGASVPVLESLVRQSLVTVRDGRLTMLEPVRQYAAERLADRTDAEILHARHLDHYLDLAERAEHAVWVFQRACPEFESLRREHDNLRKAVEWGLRSDASLAALRLISALGGYASLAGASTEFRRWWDAAFALTEGDLPLPLRARAELARATNADHGRARLELVRRPLALFREAGDEQMTARCLIELAGYMNFQGDHDAARENAERALRLAAAIGDDALIGLALCEVALGTSGLADAMRLAHEAAARLRSAGALVICAEMLSTLGLHALRNKAYDRAEELERQALEDALAIGEPWTIAFVHGNTGLAAFAAGRLAAAETAFRDELLVAHRQGFRTLFYFEGLLGLAALAATKGEDERAAILHGAAWGLNDRPIAPSETTIYEPLQDAISRAHERLGDAAWRTAEVQGGQTTIESAISLAVTTAARSSQSTVRGPSRGNIRGNIQIV